MLDEGAALRHNSALRITAAGVALWASVVSAAESSTLPAGEGDAGNRLSRTPNDVHRLIIDEPVTLAGEGRGPLTSRIVETEFPFNDLVPSWNVDVPPGAGFVVEIRVGRRVGDFWTPFYYLGGWGEAPRVEARHVEDEHGLINIDYFQSTRAYDRLQYRFHLAGADDAHLPKVKRVSLAYSNTLNDEAVARRFRKPVDPGPKEKWARRLAIPFRSQKWEDPKIRGSICSPTSVSMVLEYRGVNEPTAKVCRTVYDREYKIYGNWWRAVQGAYSYGVPGYLERFGDWDAVKRHIAAGQPVIASIRVGKGELSHAPYRQSDGHLLVVAGFDEAGHVLINDPAAQTAEQGVTTYLREDMEKVWFARGGVGYVLEPRRTSEKE